jgi:hypothetical protein
VGEERATAVGEVVYLLAELRSGQHGLVHEIGSRARVLDGDGERLTLAIACGRREDVVTCSRALVARADRSLAARRRALRAGRGPGLSPGSRAAAAGPHSGRWQTASMLLPSGS